MKKILFSVCCSLGLMGSIQSFGQSRQHQSNNGEDISKIHMGLGFGMDYGGMGFKVEYLPVKYVGVFGGAGYNFLSLGYNAGATFRPLPDAKIQPLLLGMYGYNAVINVTAMTKVSKNYYGFTTGLGGELKVGRRFNRLYVAVLYPFRSQAFKDNYDAVKANPNVTIQQDILPVTFSIGFNWAL